MILVIGKTGKIGSALAYELELRSAPTRCLVRRASGESPRGSCVHDVVGDARDPVVLREAMTGVDKVFLAMANGPKQREIELGIVDAASRAGVLHFVKVSAPVVGPDVPVTIARLHHEVEQRIEASGMAFTHLRPFAFMQNLLTLAPTIVKWRLFFATTGASPLNLVDARDVARVARTALTEPGSEGRSYVLTGPEALSYADVAERLSEVLEERVTYVQQSPAAMRRGLKRANLPEWLIDHILEIQALTVSVPEVANDVVARVTGRPPRTLDDFLTEHAGVFRGRRGLVDRGVGWLLARRAR